MITYVLDIIFPLNYTCVTSSFIFPDVKPDPYPVLIHGPAGELINFTKIGYTTGNSFALAYVIVPPNAGPPPHIHHWTDEWFYFPDGGIVMFTSMVMYPNASSIPNGVQLPKATMHRYLTKPGDLIYGPAFYVHGFRNEDNVSHLVINVWTPDVISQYFFQVGQILTSPYNVPPLTDVNKVLFVSEAPKYGINMSATWDEYVESWQDDWQPQLGMNAHGQELLDLMENTTVQTTTYRITTSDVASIKPSLVFNFLIAFMTMRLWFVTFQDSQFS